jgi:hypothetical protein
MTKMTRRGSRHDDDRHHPSLTPNARGGFFISFWATTATTTTPFLAPNVREGVSHSILDDHRHHHPSLAPNVRGGVSHLILGNNHNHHSLPCCKHERGDFSFHAQQQPQPLPPLSLQTQEGGPLYLFSATTGTITPPCSKHKGVFSSSGQQQAPPPPPSLPM